MRSLKILGLSLAGVVLVGQAGWAQTPRPKPKSAAKTAMAVWTPEVQQTLGVSATDFNAYGLNKLSKAQLQMLQSATASRPDAKRHWLVCPASGTAPSGRIRVFLTVAGDDSSGQIANQIRQAVGGLSGVDIVDTMAAADRELNVVIQEQTLGKRTIGFTASYLTGTPCSEQAAGVKKDVEVKETLGTYTDPKGADLARDLAGMLDQDLQPLRAAASR
jgi:hypothetical protein